MSRILGNKFQQRRRQYQAPQMCSHPRQSDPNPTKKSQSERALFAKVPAATSFEFRDFLKQKIAENPFIPTPHTTEYLAAKMMGRFPDGTPITKCPFHEKTMTGDNDFLYSDKNEKGEDLSVAEKIELYTKTHFSRAYLGVKQKEQELKDLAQRVREDVQTGLEYIEGLPQKAKDLGESISNKGKGIAEAISESIRILRSGDHEIPVIERTETKTVPFGQ